MLLFIFYLSPESLLADKHWGCLVQIDEIEVEIHRIEVEVGGKKNKILGLTYF